MPLSRKLGALTVLDPSGPTWPVGVCFTLFPNFRESVDFWKVSTACPCGKCHWWNDTAKGTPKYLEKKFVLMPLCPPQIPNELIWHRNRLSAMRGWRPTPLTLCNFMSALPWFRRTVARLSPANTGLIHKLAYGICGRRIGSKTTFFVSTFSFPLSLSFHPSVTEVIIILATSSVLKHTYKHRVANYLSRV